MVGEQGPTGPDGKNYSSTGVSIAALVMIILVIAWIILGKAKNWVMR